MLHETTTTTSTLLTEMLKLATLTCSHTARTLKSLQLSPLLLQGFNHLNTRDVSPDTVSLHPGLSAAQDDCDCLKDM